MEPLSYKPEEEQYPQNENWSCSACSLAWLNRALGIQFATDEYSAINYIGDPQNINSTYGLMDGSGSVLRDRLREQGAPAFCWWPSWEQLYNISEFAPSLIGGVGWYHWVGVRRAEEGSLWIANSAEGWMDVTVMLTEDNFDDLGPFAAVTVPLLTQFPPPPTY